MMMKKQMKRQGGVCSMLLPKKSLLPEEILIHDIFPKLPVKSIIRFKSVSKTWSSLLSDPYFIKLHHNHAVQHDKFSLILNDAENKRIYSIDSDSLASQKPLHITDYPFICLQSDAGFIFVGSCNGLICFTHSSSDHIQQIYLWNPSTDECILVPQPPNTTPILDALEFYELLKLGLGFGYDFKLDTYKIYMVASVSDHPGSFFTVVQSYTLGSDSWKVNNDKIPYKIRGDRSGQFLNGALHWMGTRLTEGPSETTDCHVILSFDVGDERFKELSIPKRSNHKRSALLSTFGVLSENLCIFDNSEVAFTDVWIMKEYGVSESWTKLFTIPKYNNKINSICFMELINSFKNGDILLRKHVPLEPDNIVLYDKQKKTTIPKLSEVQDVVMSCVSSLVSLNSKIYLKQELGDNSIKNLTRV